MPENTNAPDDMMPDADGEQITPRGNSMFFNMLQLMGLTSHPAPLDPIGAGDPRAVSEWWDKNMSMTKDRKQRYNVFNEMDQFDLVQTVLETYAEETTQIDHDRGLSVWIESKNQHLIETGKECLVNLQVEDRNYGIVRRTCKYGDGFQRLIYASGKGVLGWQPAEASKVNRLEDRFGRLVAFQQDGHKFRDGKSPESWPWDYVHFRLMGKNDTESYGTSLLDPLFRPWRQAVLTEDSVLQFRLRRGPSRSMFMLDCGDMTDDEALAYCNKWRKAFRKTEFVDPASSQYSKAYNPLTPLEDIFIPVRGESGTRVETLGGSGEVGETHDLNYYISKFFGAARIPKAYGGFEGDINAKATLTQQDIRFARSCKRIRKMNIYGLRTVLDYHFTLLRASEGGDEKYDIGKKDNSYLIGMSPISYLDEYERLELVQLRLQVLEAASQLGQSLRLDPRLWATHLLLHYAKLPEQLVKKLTANTAVPVGTDGAVPGTPQAGGNSDRDAVNASFEAYANSVKMSPEQRRKWLDDPEGIKSVFGRMDESMIRTDLNEVERAEVAHALHTSPELRRLIGRVTEYASEDIEEQARIQTDTSLLPVIVRGQVLEDTLTDESDAVKKSILALKALSEGKT